MEFIMRKFVLSAAAAALALSASSALAQEGTVSGAAGGAVTGAIVGGPVGAAVGGIAGAALGTVLAPPPAEVRDVVVSAPAQSVTVQEQIVVGQPLPETVILQPVPGYETYSYTVVNDQRVIVDPKTRTVIQVVN
jgi:hypothetical protein